MLVAGLKTFVKFAKMLAIGLLLLALFYGAELLLGVAAVESICMNVVFSRTTVVTCIYGHYI